MANSVDPDQTAPIGAVCSGSTLFTPIMFSNVRQLFAADDFSRRHFQMHFFLGALRVNPESANHDYSRQIKIVFSEESYVPQP